MTEIKMNVFTLDKYQRFLFPLLRRVGLEQKTKEKSVDQFTPLGLRSEMDNPPRLAIKKD